MQAVDAALVRRPRQHAIVCHSRGDVEEDGDAGALRRVQSQPVRALLPVEVAAVDGDVPSLEQGVLRCPNAACARAENVLTNAGPLAIEWAAGEQLLSERRLPAPRNANQHEQQRHCTADVDGSAAVRGHPAAAGRVGSAAFHGHM